MPDLPGLRPAKGRRGLPWPILERTWVRVLGIYLLSRLYSSALLIGIYSLATHLDWPFLGAGERPSFATFAGSWDGWFYRSIALHGYPTSLPLDASGHIAHNAWAFLPVFPLLERAIGAATGLPIFSAGIAIATLGGAGAALLLARLLEPQIGQIRALSATGLLIFGPLGFLLQVAYAESIFLLLLFGALLAVQRGRYLVAAPLAVAAAFTRPGAVVVPIAMVVQLVLQGFHDRRVPPRTGRAIVALIAMLAAGLCWPTIADHVTGTPGAYLATELSWWTGWVGRPAFVPFTPWFLMGTHWFGPAGAEVAVVVIVAATFWLVKKSPRSLGLTIQSYSLAYATYLVAVFLPQFSLPRLLLPLAPLLGCAYFTGTRTRRQMWFTAAALLQPLCIVLLWLLSYP